MIGSAVHIQVHLHIRYLFILIFKCIKMLMPLGNCGYIHSMLALFGFEGSNIPVLNFLVKLQKEESS